MPDSDRRTGGFQIVRRLGGGGAGVIYEATDSRLGARVALQRLPSELAGDLLRYEFRTLASLEHGNLVRLGELVQHNDQWFITMELVDGQSFIDYLRRDTEAVSGVAFDEAKLRAVLRFPQSLLVGKPGRRHSELHGLRCRRKRACGSPSSERDCPCAPRRALCSCYQVGEVAWL